MTPHTHASFESRGQVVDHLVHGHGWKDEWDEAGTGRPLPMSKIRVGDGSFLFPSSEFLSIHRELHLIEAPFIFMGGKK